MSEVPEFSVDALPESPGVWEREMLGTGHYVWSRDADQGEFEESVSEELLVVQVGLQYLNDEWNASLSKPNTRRGFLDVVTPRCLATDSFEDAVAHVEDLLETESG